MVCCINNVQLEYNHQGITITYCGLDTLNKNIISWNRQTPEDRKLITTQKVLDNLLRTIEKRNLPKWYAYEAMRRLLKRKKWLYSYKHQIIELIWTLSDSNDPRLKLHIQALCKEINYVKPI